MHRFAAAAALFGLSALTIAAPTSYSSSNSSGQVDFNFPLSNGFPNITKNSQVFNDTEQIALGTIPNAPPPPTPSTDSLISLGFIAFNELFEVAFFSELIDNITYSRPGYDNVPNRDQVLGVLKIVLAQEELHELNANLAFNHFTNQTIEPCTYDFPVNSFNESIALASTFTDVVLSTLPDIQTLFAQANDTGLIRGVGSVIGQEGEQNGFYRQILGKNPSALPFLTGGARDFAFSAINQGFVKPNTCPSLSLLEPTLTIFDVLKVDTDASQITSDADSTITFSAFNFAQSLSQTKRRDMGYITQADWSDLYLTYINQQNVPVSVGWTNWQSNSDEITFDASFPGKTNEMNGLTIAAVTKGKGFATPDEVAAATLFGPALIEIN